MVLFQQDDPLKKHTSLLHKDTSLSLKVKLLKKIICVERLYYRFFIPIPLSSLLKRNKTTGKMQLCFLTNNDITGGNSGSPMFDGKGRLIGLAFDGNWDSLSSDINFDRKLARCIGVDIRFVLYLMDKWGHADRLLQEINPQ